MYKYKETKIYLKDTQMPMTSNIKILRPLAFLMNYLLMLLKYPYSSFKKWYTHKTSGYGRLLLVWCCYWFILVTFLHENGIFTYFWPKLFPQINKNTKKLWSSVKRYFFTGKYFTFRYAVNRNYPENFQITEIQILDIQKLSFGLFLLSA